MEGEDQRGERLGVSEEWSKEWVFSPKPYSLHFTLNFYFLAVFITFSFCIFHSLAAPSPQEKIKIRFGDGGSCTPIG